MTVLSDGDSELFIDGKLLPGGAGRFPTVNPATEEVLGTAADADSDDMSGAIEAARRAFDDSDWSRDVALRVHCIRQLREGMKTHIEELRELTIAEVGAPRMLTAGAQLKDPWTTCSSPPIPPNPSIGTPTSVSPHPWASKPGAPWRVRRLAWSAR
ncbi:Probable aldehyde dehydrogenase AldA [Mycobacteroides abscessus]|nr:Probable aldehyde dehydrogenase AldA [Mycobacteroides abscessus]